MSAASVEELRAEIERLGERFDPLWDRAVADTLNGGAPEELREECRGLGREVRAAINRLELATTDRAVLGDFDDLGERADEAILTRAEAAGQIAEAKEPSRFDPETGKALDPLGVLNLATREIGGNVEWLEARQIGRQDARWHLTVRSRESGEPAELRSFTTAQLFEGSLSKLSARVREVRGGTLPTPRKGSDNWIKFTDALTEAAEIEEHGATEAGSWRRRLALYLDQRLDASHDPGSPEGKRAVLAETPKPLEGPDGRLWVHAGAWLEYLETKRMEADDATVRAALRHLGFERFQLTAKVGGANRSRWYWLSPEGFDWREEAG